MSRGEKRTSSVVGALDFALMQHETNRGQHRLRPATVTTGTQAFLDSTSFEVGVKFRPGAGNFLNGSRNETTYWVDVVFENGGQE